MNPANTAGPVLWGVNSRGVAAVTLNRPEVNNAYNGELIQGLLAALDALGVARPACRRPSRATASISRPAPISSGSTPCGIHRRRKISVSRARPPRRCTAQSCAGADRGAGARRLLRRRHRYVAACDVVIAADNAMFSIAEVRWGLTAAIIMPQLNDAISVRQLRRYGLTGERFGAEEARRIGLVQRWCRSPSLQRPASASSAKCWRTARTRSPRPRR